MDSGLFERLPQGSMLKALGPRAYAALTAKGVRRRLERDRALFSQGDPGDSMVMVLSGLLKAYVVTARGREVVFDYFGPGAVIGEMAVFDGGSRSATVVACEASEVLNLQARDVLRYLEGDGAAALKVISLLCHRLRKTNALVEDAAASAMGPRLARAIVRLTEDPSFAAEAGGPVVLKMRQSDLAAYAGLSRENVNRQLQEWAERGLVATGRNRLEVRNPLRLEEIAEDFD